MLSITNKIRESKIHWLQLDETSDISADKLPTINIKYLLDGTIQNKFLCLKKLTKLMEKFCMRHLKKLS